MDFNIMKKIVFGLLMTMGLLNAQNNLVFNRVLDMAITSTSTATVPEGKVWKIESSSQAVYVDKPNVDYGIPIISQPFSTGSGDIVWLSENSTISVSSGVGKVSILEFNVVPTSTGTGSGTGGGGVSSDGLIFEEALSITLPITQIESSAVRYYADIVVPEGKILKIINVSTYVEYSGNGNTTGENYNNVYIGPELFIPLQNTNQNVNRFLPQGTYLVKTVGTSATNKVVINAIQYTQ